MAKARAAEHFLGGLSYEQQMQDLPELPDRPILFDSDYPTGELASMGEAKFQMERQEREYQSRAALSGFLATPWANLGPQSPAERELELERQEDVRRYRNGLPDSPADMPPRVGDRRSR